MDQRGLRGTKRDRGGSERTSEDLQGLGWINGLCMTTYSNIVRWIPFLCLINWVISIKLVEGILISDITGCNVHD